jgi:hypothetical protein
LEWGTEFSKIEIVDFSSSHNRQSIAQDPQGQHPFFLLPDFNACSNAQKALLINSRVLLLVEIATFLQLLNSEIRVILNPFFNTRVLNWTHKNKTLVFT